MKTATYFSISIVLIVIALLLSNCGGGTDRGAIPEIASPQQNQNLINTDVKGYIFHKSSISSSETGEEDNDFQVIEIPMTGDEGFLNQVTEYFQDTSSRVNTEEGEELLKTFTEEAALYQPLPLWQPSAQIFGIYNETPITLNGDGSFAGTVSTDDAEDTVGLEILIPEGDSYEVETIAASEEVTSSDNTGVTLKSCPQKIIIKPGQCEIFKVFSKPSINLYEAGLQFSLANPEIGCLAGPIFIKCGGQKKNSIAYGILYVKKNVDSPLDTSINVTDTQGRSLSIPLQVVRKTASVSGKVYTGGVPLVKGNVKSIGPKSFCHLDSEGNYVLPKTFMGSGRKVIATWWTLEGGKQVKHREVKYVDLYGDMTGVNFGVVPPEPTPTKHPPGDSFYDIKVATVLNYLGHWEELLGKEEAIRKTVGWLNRNEPSDPPPPEDISKAWIDDYNNTIIFIEFTDGVIVDIMTASTPIDPNTISNLERQKLLNYQQIGDYKKNTSPTPIITASDRICFEPQRILILSPFSCWQWWIVTNGGFNSVEYSVVPYLKGNDYYKDKIKAVITTSNEFYFDYANPVPNEGPYSDATHPLVNCTLRPGANLDNIVTPGDFGDLFDPSSDSMCNYGMVYITSHGCPDCVINASLWLEGSDGKLISEIDDWKKKHTEGTMWRLSYLDVHFDWLDPMLQPSGADKEKYTEYFYIKTIALKSQFFEQLNTSKGFGSIIYANSCFSARLSPAFSSAKIYLGSSEGVSVTWGNGLGFLFFKYMLNGPPDPYAHAFIVPGFNPFNVDTGSLPELNKPMHAYEVWETFKNYKISPDPWKYPDAYKYCNNTFLELYQLPGTPDIYFPGRVDITVY